MYISLINKIFKSIQEEKSDRLFYFPSKISIETGNICNLACPLCPTSDKEQKDVEKGFLSFENFKIIFDKIKPFVKTVDLFSWGEPFLNKDIGRIIEYAKAEKPKLRIFIDSNLNIMNDSQIDAIVRYGLDVLKVSCDGATQSVYSEYRRGGDINKVMENVKKILERKKVLKSEKPKIIWKYLVFKHNQHEVEMARQMAKEMNIHFEASGMRTDCGKEIFEKIAESIRRDSSWIPDDPAYNNYTDLRSGKKFCEKPWRTLTINWDGEVTPCGAIYDCVKYSFGNLLKEDFNRVWNGERFRLARRIILGKCDDSGIICAVCKKNGYQFF